MFDLQKEKEHARWLQMWACCQRSARNSMHCGSHHKGGTKAGYFGLLVRQSQNYNLVLEPHPVAEIAQFCPRGTDIYIDVWGSTGHNETNAVANDRLHFCTQRRTSWQWFSSGRSKNHARLANCKMSRKTALVENFWSIFGTNTVFWCLTKEAQCFCSFAWPNERAKVEMPLLRKCPIIWHLYWY